MLLDFQGKKYNLPDFFIVGAPKCGTSAIANYLRQHPQIYMPYRKELHHFATDLYDIGRRQFDQEFFYSFFEDANADQVVGEASVFHLFSSKAAANIFQFNPKAKILIMLRNPADMLYSYHSQLLYNGDEDIEDFKIALNAEADRKHGNSIPNDVKFASMLYYSEVVSYTKQVQRYLDTFPKNQVKIVLFDDFRSDTLATYKSLLNFLDVKEDFVPDIKIINPNKVSRSSILRKLYGKQPQYLQKIGRFIMPFKKSRKKLLRKLKSMNTKKIERKKLSSDLKRELMERFKPEIQNLENLLNKDLSKWYNLTEKIEN